MTRYMANLFIAAYESRSISDAAKASMISRSSVSKAISDIEKEYKVTLFNRTQNGIQPTEEATQLYFTVIRTNQMFDELKDAFSTQEKQESSVVNIGVMASACYSAIHVLINEFRGKNPDHIINVRQIRPNSYYHELISGNLDMVLTCTSSNDESPSFLRIQKICEIRPTFVMKSRHPILQNEKIIWKNACSYPFITLADTPEVLKNSIRYYLNANSLPIKTNLQINDILTIRDMIFSHDAIAVLPNVSVNAWDNVFTQPINTGAIEYSLSLISNIDHDYVWREDLLHAFQEALSGR